LPPGKGRCLLFQLETTTKPNKKLFKTAREHTNVTHGRWAVGRSWGHVAGCSFCYTRGQSQIRTRRLELDDLPTSLWCEIGMDGLDVRSAVSVRIRALYKESANRVQPTILNTILSHGSEVVSSRWGDIAGGCRHQKTT
jgi:hypothetical protein